LGKSTIGAIAAATAHSRASPGRALTDHDIDLAQCVNGKRGL